MSFHKYTLKLQDKLTRLGYQVGRIDGVAGPKTAAAVRSFLIATGRRDRDFSGPVLTVAGHVRATYRKYVERVEGTMLTVPWCAHATNQLGVQEFAGDEHNPKIVDWFRKIASPWFVTDETPWCAAFVGAMLEDVGIPSTKSARARSYETWGEPCDAVPGAIVVLSRGANVKQGHVGFLVAEDLDEDKICLLGGNQGDAVSIAWFPRSRLVQYRWPKGCAKPKDAVCMKSTGIEPTTD